jgi:hypothetical protein
MSAEKLQEYIDSIDELQKAYSKVKEYGAIIGDVSRCLITSPYKMTVSNVKVSFPLTADREYSLNADNWPSAQQLAEVLSDYISKREKVKRLYSSLSEAQRNSVKPPPDI